MILPEREVVVIYDLRDADQWEQAREDRERWGRSRSQVHALDADHIAIVFESGSILEETA